MAVQVKLFASLRERIGLDETEVAAADGMSVSDVWAAAVPDQPLPTNTLAAVNMEYTDLSTTVSDGDEVAFFPPVTGG